MKKIYYFLNINLSNMIVLKFFVMPLLYIYYQTVSKQCFLVDESRYQSYVYFQALKRHFLAKNHFSFKLYSKHMLISLNDPSNKR